MQYVIFNVSNLGFLKQSMDALVDGIVDAISRAHTLVRPAKIYVRYSFYLEIVVGFFGCSEGSHYLLNRYGSPSQFYNYNLWGGQQYPPKKNNSYKKTLGSKSPSLT